MARKRKLTPEVKAEAETALTTLNEVEGFGHLELTDSGQLNLRPNDFKRLFAATRRLENHKDRSTAIAAVFAVSMLTQDFKSALAATRQALYEQQAEVDMRIRQQEMLLKQRAAERADKRLAHPQMPAQVNIAFVERERQLQPQIENARQIINGEIE